MSRRMQRSREEKEGMMERPEKLNASHTDAEFKYNTLWNKWQVYHDQEMKKQQEINNAVLADKCDELERFAKPHPINTDKVMAVFRVKFPELGFYHEGQYSDFTKDVESFLKRACNGEIK